MTKCDLVFAVVELDALSVGELELAQDQGIVQRRQREPIHDSPTESVESIAIRIRWSVPDSVLNPI